MTTKPIYSFNNGASLGIGQVPNNSVVIVEDSDGVGTSLQVVKKANTGITAASTITDFLADKTLYDNPAQDREYGVRETIRERIYKVDKPEVRVIKDYSIYPNPVRKILKLHNNKLIKIISNPELLDRIKPLPSNT